MTPDSIEKLITIRPMKPDESEFVSHSWCKSVRGSYRVMRAIPRKVFYACHQAGVDATMKVSNCIVASPIDQPTLVVAWLVYEDRGSPDYVILHYCYVKKQLRGMGLHKILIDQVQNGRELVATHYTNRIKNLCYNPYFFKQEHL